MLKKSDILTLLMALRESGEPVDTYISNLYKRVEIDPNTIKFINDKREIDLARFYEKLRKSYNSKHSTLYINIVKEDIPLEDILTTLASYNLQALLFAKKVDNKDLFYRASRVEEVTRVLNNYYKTYDIDQCKTVLTLIKADIKLFEALKN